MKYIEIYINFIIKYNRQMYMKFEDDVKGRELVHRYNHVNGNCNKKWRNIFF